MAILILPGTADPTKVLVGSTFSAGTNYNATGTLDLSLLVTGNIKAGVTINGVAGKTSVVDTSDATAIASQILAGLYAYVNGSKLTGTITSKTTQTYTPGTTNQTIASGQYLSGNQTISGDANLIAANILSGVSIFGVAGSVTITSLGGKRVASGTATWSNGSGLTISGLAFTATAFIVMSTGTSPIGQYGAYYIQGVNSAGYCTTISSQNGINNSVCTITSSSIAIGGQLAAGATVSWIAFG